MRNLKIAINLSKLCNSKLSWLCKKKCLRMSLGAGPTVELSGEAIASLLPPRTYVRYETYLCEKTLPLWFSGPRTCGIPLDRITRQSVGCIRAFKNIHIQWNIPVWEDIVTIVSSVVHLCPPRTRDTARPQLFPRLQKTYIYGEKHIYVRRKLSKLSKLSNNSNVSTQ